MVKDWFLPIYRFVVSVSRMCPGASLKVNWLLINNVSPVSSQYRSLLSLSFFTHTEPLLTKREIKFETFFCFCFSIFPSQAPENMGEIRRRNRSDSAQCEKEMTYCDRIYTTLTGKEEFSVKIDIRIHKFGARSVKSKPLVTFWKSAFMKSSFNSLFS